MKRRLGKWCLDRMLKPVYDKHIYREYNLNPEDWDQVAYFMLMGLLGRDGGEPEYTDVGGRRRPPTPT